jgi:UMF1 family MFS transporter
MESPAPSDVTPPPAGRLERLAWCGFDFANSAYTTLIVTVAYPLRFAKTVVGDPDLADRWWAAGLALSQGIVLLAAPIVGAAADAKAAKKPFLLASWLVCAAGAAALTWPGQGAILAAWLLLVISNVAFAAGENLVAGFLPELAPPEEQGRLSGLGWAVGYCGGLLALVFAAMLAHRERAELIPLLTGAFMFAAGLPTFLLLRERAKPRPATGSFLRAAFADATLAWRERGRFPDLLRLLWSLFWQQAGVVIVISFAGLYGAGEIGLSEQELFVLFIVLQLAAALGATGFGRLQDRRGTRVALAAAVATWLVAVLLAVVAHGRGVFYVSAALSGAAMGGSQCVGRAAVGLFAPPGRAGAWFGLWGLATKAAGVAGLVAFAVARAAADRRLAMLATAGFFAVGLYVLRGVDEARGRAAAAESPP